MRRPTKQSDGRGAAKNRPNAKNITKIQHDKKPHEKWGETCD